MRAPNGHARGQAHEHTGRLTSTQAQVHNTGTRAHTKLGGTRARTNYMAPGHTGTNHTGTAGTSAGYQVLVNTISCSEFRTFSGLGTPPRFRV